SRLMFDVANPESAMVTVATSSDPNHRPDFILTDDPKEFWMSTGLFPQEFVISFNSQMEISSISLSHVNIQHMEVFMCPNQDGENFDPLCEEDLDQAEGSFNTASIPLKKKINVWHLRFLITSVSDHFVAVQKVKVEGRA
ncbi:hypothetical protein BOX15_Mlig023458g1, partial [Macrostomum lignano]